jgi:indole-3-acetate monooxygenase
MNFEQDLVQKARSIAFAVAPRAGEIEAARQLPPDVSRLMGEAGFYRMFICERQGGLEISPAVAAQVYEALAEGDAACGWVAFIGATTGLAVSRLTDEAVGEILCRPDALISGVFAASGVATKV